MAKAQDVTGLDCGGPALAGVERVLKTRISEMCSFRDAAAGTDDVHGIHDMRVASRRLRNTLRDFQPVLRRRRLRAVRRRLRKIARRLGAVRDEDVALKALEKMAAEAPTELATAMDAFVVERRRRRRHAHHRLDEVIARDSISELPRELESALADAKRPGAERDVSSGEGAAPEDGTFRELGHTTIFRRLDEMLERATALYTPFDTEALHRLRIAAKRMRYALELFSVCWDGPLLDLAKEVEDLQARLGDLHDCDIWIAEVGSRLGKTRESGDEGGNAAGTRGRAERDAAIWLLNRFVALRTDHFLSALDLWQHWQNHPLKDRLVDATRAQSAGSESVTLNTDPATAAAFGTLALPE